MTGPAAFEVQWSAEDHSFAAVLNGFWTEADVGRFGAELARVIGLAAGRPFDGLVDVSAVGPQAVIAAQAQLVGVLVTAGLRRLAVAGAGPLLAMQARRATAGVETGFLPDAPAARAWLRRAAAPRAA
jgi:hypothetical protein